MTIHIKSIAKNICKRIKKDRDIRLAVVGNTSHGKTYFLEDIFAFIPTKRLGLDVIGEVRPFGYISKFATDIKTLSKSNKIDGVGKTTRYACRHIDHYSVKLRQNGKNFNFSFLDIPGEVINTEIFQGCQIVYQNLQDNKNKFIYVTTWKDKQDSHIEKTVSTKEIVEGKIKSYDKDANSFNTNQSKIRSEKYSIADDIFSYYNEFYNITREEKISGKDFIDNFYDFDADSAYQFICDYYRSISRKITGGDEEYYKSNIAQNFYFYYFLFRATDIVLIERLIDDNTAVKNEENTTVKSENNTAGKNEDNTEEKKEKTLLDSVADLAEIKTAKFYLGIKGADEFLNPTIFNNYYKKLKSNIKDKAPEKENYIHNIIYSATTIEIGKAIEESLNADSESDKNKKEAAEQLGAGLNTDKKEEKIEELLNANSESDENNNVATEQISAGPNADKKEENKEREKKEEAVFPSTIKDKIELALPSEGLISMNNDNKQKVRNILNKFCNNSGYRKNQLNIPQHTYFIATPITHEYVIDTFVGDGINGDSSKASQRCYFGSLQLIEDVLKDKGKALPESYEATGEFLKFIRGTDKN